MKKIIFILLIGVAVFATSCNNNQEQINALKDRIELLEYANQELVSTVLPDMALDAFERGYNMGFAHHAEFGTWKVRKWEEDLQWMKDQLGVE